MNLLPLYGTLSLALLLAIVALAREHRLRRAVETLLRSVLAHLQRPDDHEQTVAAADRAAGRPADRVR
jgi:hypothetical protein